MVPADTGLLILAPLLAPAPAVLAARRHRLGFGPEAAGRRAGRQPAVPAGRLPTRVFKETARSPQEGDRPAAPANAVPSDRPHLASVEAVGDATIDAPLPLPGREPVRVRARALAMLAWARRHALDAATMAAATGAAAVVHAIGMSGYPAFFADEGTYVSRAWAVDRLHSLAPYTYWYDHPPLGWLLMALWTRIVPTFGSGQYAIAAARDFMLAVFIVSASLVYLVARRLGLRRPFAAFAVLLFGLSPLAVYYQRMVLLDNIGLAWLLAAFLLALTPSRRLASYAAAGACLAAAVLTKETFLLFAPGVLVAVWQTSRSSSRRFAVGVFVTLFVLIGSFYPLFAVLRGELLQGRHHTSLMYGVTFQLTRPGTGSVLSATSATRAIVDGWLAKDPFLLGSGVVLLPLGLALRRSRAVAVALLIPLLMLTRPGGYLPGMYVIGLLPFAALIVASVLDWLWRPLQTRIGEWRDERRRRVYRSRGTRRRLAARRMPAATAVVLIAVFALLAAPRWYSGNASAMTVDAVRPQREAVTWIATHVRRGSYLLVGDSIWTDLVDRGFPHTHVVWFYELDSHPRLRISWRTFDYVVRSSFTPSRAWGPNARRVVGHSREVVTFRYGREWVQIRHVLGG